MKKTTQTEDFKNTLLQLKGLEAELRAYEITFAALKQTLEPEHPGFSQLADDALAAVRRSPALAEILKKYDEALEKFFQPGTEVLSQEELLRLLGMPLQTTKVQ